MVTEAVVSFITTCDSKSSMPVGVDYVGKSGKTGPAMKNLIQHDIKLLQTCQNCMQSTPSQDIHSDTDVCDTVCGACCDSKAICVECDDRGHHFWQPSLRPCRHCFDKGVKCVKTVILVYVTDCEEGNKKAMELLLKDKEDETESPHMTLTVVIPDAVHLGKSLKCSFSNWFLHLGGERSSLAIIRTLRDKTPSGDVRQTFRKLLKDQEAVRNKDRMKVDVVVDLTRPPCVQPWKLLAWFVTP